MQVPVGIERADVFVDTPTEVHGSRGVVVPCSSLQQHPLAPIRRVDTSSHLKSLLLERSSSNSIVSASELRAWALHWSGVPEVKHVMWFGHFRVHGQSFAQNWTHLLLYVRSPLFEQTTPQLCESSANRVAARV